MSRREYVDLIVSGIKDYYNTRVMDSIKRNKHMNKYSGETVSDETVKAIIVDVANYLAFKQGIDLAMYTEDLGK